MTLSLDDFGSLVRARRTHMIVDHERSVPTDLLEQLCDLIQWAPNHKRTWPWRFASLTGDARLRLGEAFVADMVARDFGDEIKRTKTLGKYTRAPNVLVVGCASNVNPTIHNENRDAVAVGIGNLLLGATAAGLASFWSTPPLIDSPRALALCGFDASDRIIGVIYLGWPVGTIEAPQRPAPVLRHIAN